MPNSFALTMLVLVLSILIFVVSSETAYKLEHRRFFNYANPTYISMVATSIGSLAASFFCLLSLHSQAKKDALEKSENLAETK